MIYKNKNMSRPKFGEIPVTPYDRVLEVMTALILIALYVLYFTKESWIPADVVLDKETGTKGLVLLLIETAVIIVVGISAYTLKWVNFPIVIYPEAMFVQYTMISRMIRECNLIASLFLFSVTVGCLYEVDIFIYIMIVLAVLLSLFIGIKSLIITRRGRAIAEMSK